MLSNYFTFSITGSTNSFGTKNEINDGYVWAPYISMTAMPVDFVCPNCGCEKIEISISLNQSKYECENCGNKFPVTKKEYKKLSRKRKIKRVLNI
jgi:predicted RNA-binding Zn-ribbon protein involved in translation (DUF1610 family)